MFFFCDFFLEQNFVLWDWKKNISFVQIQILRIFLEIIPSFPQFLCNRWGINF